MKRLLNLLLLCCLSILSLQAQNFNTGTSSQPAKAAYNVALKAIDNGSWDVARTELDKALQLDGSYIDALLASGLVNRVSENYEAAEKDYQKALNEYPRSLVAHQQLALMYEEEGKLTEALEMYKKLLKHHPNFPEGHMGIAKTLFSIGESEMGTDSLMAITAFNNSIKASEVATRIYANSGNPRNAADARMLSGRAHMEMGNYNLALKQFKACKKQLGDKPYYYYYLALGYMGKGDKEKAQANMDLAKTMGYKVPKYLVNRMENWK
ncbi:MAG: tetratricopeptide repeat protein [Bacteroidota bacterium]